MNLKLFSILLLLATFQILGTYQKPLPDDDDDDDDKDDYHDNDDKKENSGGDNQIVGAASDDESKKPADDVVPVVESSSEGKSESVGNDGESPSDVADKSNEEGKEYIDKAQKLLEGEKLVDSDGEPKTAEVKSAPVVENNNESEQQQEQQQVEEPAENKKENDAIDSSASNSKPDVDYQEDPDKISLKLEPYDPAKEEPKEENKPDEIVEVHQPAEIRQELKEPTKVDEEKEKEKEIEIDIEKDNIKKPQEIKQEVGKEASVDKQKVAVNVAPTDEKSGKVEEVNKDKISGRAEAEHENKPPPKAGKVNTFFIIIPGIVLAFVVLIVVAFVIFQKTRSNPEQPASVAGGERRPIYAPVPTDPPRA